MCERETSRKRLFQCPYLSNHQTPSKGDPASSAKRHPPHGGVCADRLRFLLHPLPNKFSSSSGPLPAAAPASGSSAQSSETPGTTTASARTSQQTRGEKLICDLLVPPTPSSTNKTTGQVPYPRYYTPPSFPENKSNYVNIY